MQKYINLLVILSFLLSGSGCSIDKLYPPEPVEKIRLFDEEVSAVVIKKDSNEIIALGKEYIYILKPDDILNFVLNWSEKKHIKATFADFNADASSNIQFLSGRYILTVELNNELSQEAVGQLLTHGFTYNVTKTALSYQGKLHGRYYAHSSSDVNFLKAYQLNQKYKIKVRETTTTMVRKPKPNATIFLESVAGIVSIPLVLVLLPIIAPWNAH